jgi:hypothetical protein
MTSLWPTSMATPTSMLSSPTVTEPSLDQRVGLPTRREQGFPCFDTTLSVVVGDVDGDDDPDSSWQCVRNQPPARQRRLGPFADETPMRLPALVQVSIAGRSGIPDSDSDLDLVVANRGSQNRTCQQRGGSLH